ncbi:hypothetical protein [Marinobacterium aestuariivivens]|uniref:Uncharacterized protein n=1 Tax=Marinobacterium aestuariivivens TaxID=1698799 RepID=A0ABW2A8N8_9GAMM
MRRFGDALFEGETGLDDQRVDLPVEMAAAGRGISAAGFCD